MNNRLKTFICTILCAISLTTPVAADEISDLQGQAQSNQQKADAMNEQVTKDKSKLSELQDNMNKMLNEMKSLDAEIGQAQGEINKLQEKLQDLNNQAVTLEADVKKMQGEVEKSKEKMKERLKYLYKHQGNGYLDMVFSSSNLAELISRLDFMNRIANHDQAMVDDLKAKEAKLNDSLNELQKVKREVEASKKESEAKAAKLQSNKSEKDKLYAKIQDDAQNQQALIEKQESEVDALIQRAKDLQGQAEQKQKEKDERDAANQAAQNSNQGNVEGNNNVSQGGIFSITGGTRYPITSPYELGRTNPITGKTENHEALDIGAPYGVGVYALKAGVVIYSGVMTGYGNVVMIDHGDIITLYAHNSSLVVEVGQNVQGGQLISYVGSTGMSTGPHIHFEVRDESGHKMNPTNYYI